MSTILHAAWRYRGLIVSSVVNEFKSRLARSRFGVAWLVLQPLAQVLIFATVMANILASRIPGIENKYSYVVYLMAGISCWSLFVEIVTRSLTVFIDNGSLLKKIQFPRICLPLIVIGSALVNNVALLVIVLIAMPLMGIYPGISMLWLPLLMLLTIALAAGIGLLLGTLNVFSRDVGQVMQVVMQLWFWMTPIVYHLAVVPKGLEAVLAFNPVAPLVASYQGIFLFGTGLADGLPKVVIITALMLALSLFVFRRASAEMVDVL
jgi:lipopolysaccharide transport system permease protein